MSALADRYYSSARRRLREVVEGRSVIEPDIFQLIETYRLAWNARDFEKMASLFSEPATYITPTGNLHIPDRAALITKLRQQFSEMEVEQFDHTEIGEIIITPCNEYAAIAELKNLRRLRTDGSEIIAMDAMYICVIQDGAWRLSVALAGQCGWND
jgi:ketosteroid isomerase-like protein